MYLLADFNVPERVVGPILLCRSTTTGDSNPLMRLYNHRSLLRIPSRNLFAFSVFEVFDLVCLQKKYKQESAEIYYTHRVALHE